MKRIIFFLFLFASIAATAQTITSDTTYIQYNATYDEFFEVRSTMYSDGKLITVAQPIGDLNTAGPDTAIVENYFFNRAVDQARQFAGYANEVWKKSSTVKFILIANTALNNLVGNTITGISAQTYGPAAVGSWQISSNGGTTFTACTISQPTASTLRLTIGGNNYNLFAIGDQWIRGISLPTVGTVDLHKVSGKAEFRNVERTVILKK